MALLGSIAGALSQRARASGVIALILPLVPYKYIQVSVLTIDTSGAGW